MSEQKVNIELSLAEANLLLKFLDDLGDELSCAGCNDLVLDNTDENWQMVKNAFVESSGSFDMKRPKGTEIDTEDFVLCGYIATIIKRQL